MSQVLFRVGDSINLDLPIFPDVRIRSQEYESHRIKVESIRDIFSRPLSVNQLLARPFLMRSRWQICGKFEDGRIRRFYLGTSRQQQTSGLLHVGIYERGESQPCKIIGRPFDSSKKDRELLVKALNAWKVYKLRFAKLRVFAIDQQQDLSDLLIRKAAIHE